MIKRVVTIKDDTGHVIAEWCGGDEQTLSPVIGRTHIVLPIEDTTSYTSKRWNGTSFEDLPPSPPDPSGGLDHTTLLNAIIWVLIDRISPPCTVVKFNNSRDKIIEALATQPWKQ